MQILPQVIKLAERLQRVIAADPQYKPGSLLRPWYLTVLDNPAIKPLWRRYCASHNIACGPHDTPSDQERYVFELSLLHPAVRNAVEVYVAQQEARMIRDAPRETKSGP